MLGLAGAGVVGAGAGFAADRFVVPQATATGQSGAAASYLFYGAHQSGITTAAQDRLHFASFDVSDIGRSDLIGLLRDWTVAAGRMAEGRGAGPDGPVKAEDTSVVEKHVWVPPGDSRSWMTGGSYLVARKIRMTIETWDRTALGEQERVIGRTKGEGAPRSGDTEFLAPNFTAESASHDVLIDEKAHMRLAHPTANQGAVLLRRGYNFVDGNDDLGRLNAGLFFIAFQRDPRTQFVPIQTRLSGNDAMNEYLRHVGSGIFAVPPGAARGSYIGAWLFGS
jgi:deferrochelatase/peroxidase EfeB